MATGSPAFGTRTPRRLLLAAFVVALGLAGSGRLAIPDAIAAELSIGWNVAVATDALNLRSGAGLGATVLAVMPFGTRATVLDGPVSLDGYDWYFLDPEGYPSGWAAGGFLVVADDVAPPVPPGGFLPVGAETVVATDALNLRSAADIRAPVIAVMPSGTAVRVLDEPFPASGYWWYRLDTRYGIGWAAGDFLDFPSGERFPVGTLVAPTSALNLRDTPALAGAVIAILPEDITVTVVGSPIGADGYVWYELETPFGTGWSAGAYLAEAGGPGDGPGAGATAVVFDGPLNLRAGFGLGSGILAVLPDGAVVTIRGGAVVADGYAWLPVVNARYGEGWVAGEFLVTV